MDCREFTERLDDYADGVLPLPDRVAADAHKEACDDCRSLAKTYDTTVALLALHAAGGDAETPSTTERDQANLRGTYEESLPLGEAAFRTQMPESLKEQMEARLFEALRRDRTA